MRILALGFCIVSGVCVLQLHGISAHYLFAQLLDPFLHFSNVFNLNLTNSCYNKN